MRKENLGPALVLALLLALLLLPFTDYHLPITECLAEEETFTITTYYPSPYGSYNELSTNKFAVGDADGDGKVTTTDQPNRNGDIRLKPQSGDPASWPTGTGGQISYSDVKDTLYVNNGSTWVAQGGSVVIYSPKCTWSCETGSYSSWMISCTSSCTPPSCASGYTDLGTGCAGMGGGVALVGQKWDFTSRGNGYGYCERYCAKQ